MRPNIEGSTIGRINHLWDLPVLFVASNSPYGHEGGDGEEGIDLMGYAAEITATNEDGAHGINEVVHGVDIGGQIGTGGHGACGREESAEEHQADDKEPHDEHGLLHGVAVVGDDESER